MVQADTTGLIVEALSAVGVSQMVPPRGTGLPAPLPAQELADTAFAFPLRTVAGDDLAASVADAPAWPVSAPDGTVRCAHRLAQGPRRGTHGYGWVGGKATTHNR
jgi:hypothetical protein